MSSLKYTTSDYAQRTIEGLRLSQDKANKYWLWSDALEINIAYKELTEKDCMLSAIDSLLFHIQLQHERIAKLEKIANLTQRFQEEVNQLNKSESD